MCQIHSKFGKRHYFRFRTMESKIYHVCVFCGRRSSGYRCTTICHAFCGEEKDWNWFAKLQRPATRTEYEQRMVELNINSVPPMVHRPQ